MPLAKTLQSYAWPPHQIMAWVGLERYGYLEDAQRLAYRFLYMWAFYLFVLFFNKIDASGIDGI